MSRPWIYPLILVLLVLAIYSNSVHGQFVFDDNALILQNPAIMSVDSLSSAMNFSGARPLLNVTYGLNYYFSGVSPTSYHWTNILIHALNSVLVYFILLQFVESTSGFLAFAGSAVFATHTLATSAVSYISGRSSLLCATFYFLSALLLLYSLNPVKPTGRRIYSLLACFLSAYLAWSVKQEAIVLPLFFAAIVYIRGVRLLYLAPLLTIPALIALSFRQSISALYSSTSANITLVNAGFDTTLSPIPFFLTYITNLVGYYYPRLLIPIGLSIDPAIQPVAAFYSPEFLTSITILILLLYLACRFRLTHPLLSLGLFAILLSPLSAYALIPLADPVQEHRAYISLLGIAFIFTYLLSHFRRYSVQISLVLIPFLASLTYARNPVWSSPLTLWTDAVSKSPNAYRPHFNLGTVLNTSGQWQAALNEYSRAIAINPNLTAAYSNSAGVYADLASTYITTNQLDLAIRAFSGAETMLLRVVTLSPNFTEGWINLGVVYMREGRFDEAKKALDRALAINPDSFPAHYNSAEVLTLKGDLGAARDEYQIAFKLRPDIAVSKTKIIELERKLP